mmetsp:Transcript_78485/g.163056  ORF Transcript_78485/g.163056 Transcript_78485/m.163056 type:complete len:571 (-) Transcript_78485:73-1785(-)|eukprot:CAMPEP_0206457172 /NCGR_PEP_ID=MMETSP0324_2-20121206/22804_1 /ASSEMBLY_ACC=CAM_ASM_000836 /TAXON_ID=2866 /ORGANISM="Crypthecodinium cohnii, Strain Seligo" /LENGTH=570 /DNA_ID=CAMNT_0053928245 /DNA_START=204 /DNA_END=1916 /DNA_ORIENTATION=-
MQYEAEIPSGLRVGESFMAQTPYGVVPVQVPPGYRPGQRIRFNVDGSTGRPQQQEPTVVVGRPLTGDVEGGRGGYGSYRYRVDPKDATVSGMPFLQGIPVKQAERKVEEIHKGGDLAAQHEPFPDSRKCQDPLWILPFFAVVAAVIVAAIIFAPQLNKDIHSSNKDVDWPTLSSVLVGGGAGAAVSLLSALAFSALAKAAPGCVVWTSLLLGPSLVVAMGAAMLVFGSGIVGLIFIALGAMMFGCVFICWRPFIPFTIRIVEMVSGVMMKHPGLVGVSFIGTVVGIAWTIVWGIAFAGLYQKVQGDISSHQTVNADGTTHVSRGQSAEFYGMLFGAALAFYWGAQTIYNVCHVTYCGVFGRWYFQRESNSLVKSFTVAVTTSFGSICFGSFLMAAIRALETVVSNARRNAQEDGNIFACIMLMLVECVISCIGDLLEYFSEWAYVQCAVRGVSFMDAARITYSMMTCANMEYVISDLLINSVVSLGAILCAMVSGGCGAVAGAVVGGKASAITGAIIGAFCGAVAGGNAVGILNSGAKTILALWAEDPRPLMNMNNDMHNELEEKIMSKM